jgi:ribosomal protein S14
MARKSLIRKARAQHILLKKYALKRIDLKKKLLKDPYNLNILKKIQQLSRNSSKTRKVNRCFRTGHSTVKAVNLNNLQFREFMKQGVLPGLTK